MAVKIKTLSPDQLKVIDKLVNVAEHKATGDVKYGKYDESDYPWRYHYHMDQMAMREGVRQGRIDTNYR